MTSASAGRTDETEGVKKDNNALDQLIVLNNKKGSSSPFLNYKVLESTQPAAAESMDVIDMNDGINPRQISSAPPHTSTSSSQSSAVQMSSSSLSPSRTVTSHPAASSYWHHYNYHVNPNNGNGIPHGTGHAIHGSPFSHHSFDHTSQSHHFDPHPSLTHHYHPPPPSEGHYYHERHHHPSEISKSGYQILAPNFVSWNYRN